VAKNDYHLAHIVKLPSGRAMAGTCAGVRFVNVYAPSGTAKKTQREHFYTNELPELYHSTARSIVLGGDFNCFLHPVDTPGHYNTSRTLKETVEGLHLTDAWTKNALRPAYTHHTLTGASRIDRFYVSRDLTGFKTGAGRISAPVLKPFRSRET
jgi:exonuclease III